MDHGAVVADVSRPMRPEEDLRTIALANSAVVGSGPHASGTRDHPWRA
jgi:hypothetical protein